MSKKSKNVILTEKPKNFKKIRKHQKSQKTLFEPFWYHFWPFLVIWRQTKFTNVTRTPLHQKCQSQDIVQAGPPILFLVYFYDSYLQHIKSCQGKVDFEMKARISLWLIMMNFIRIYENYACESYLWLIGKMLSNRNFKIVILKFSRRRLHKISKILIWLNVK